jgi:hypothetical protein
MRLLSWFPGSSAKTLEERRREAQSDISGERLFVERMAQRPRPEIDLLDEKWRDDVLKKLSDIYEATKQTDDVEELEDLVEDAELQGLFAAYLCPVTQIKMEGDLILDQIEGWGIPKASTETARRIWEEATKNGKGQQPEARGALYTLFAERDLWDDYLDDYSDTTDKTIRRLFLAIVALLVVGVLSLRYAFSFSPLLILGMLAAGAAGAVPASWQRCRPLTSASPANWMHMFVGS